MHRTYTLLIVLSLLCSGLCAHVESVPVKHTATGILLKDTLEQPTDTITPDTLAAPSAGDEDEGVEPNEADEAEPLEPLDVRLRHLLDNDIFDRTQVGIYVYDLTADSLLFTYHERQCMRPASNEKLITAITALHELGTNYEYTTHFYTDGEVNDSTLHGHLYVKGGYDPLLDAADLRAVTDSLRARGIYRIEGDVRTDLRFKDSKRWGWGWCWDDDEVPITPLLYKNKDRFADGIRAALHEAGIGCNGSVQEGRIPSSARKLCTRHHNIDQVLLPMMKQSNNSMAESLFYQMAAHRTSQSASRKQGAQCVNELISQLGLTPSHYQIADGSGLSLYNYLTPELLGNMLRFAYRNEAIYRHLLPSLPIAGEDGTLRKRMRGTLAQGNVKAKTGTVEGVSTLSGYCTTAAGHVLCFSIMNQGIRHTSTGRNFQDRVCRTLVR